jgi:hypothetical protein
MILLILLLLVLLRDSSIAPITVMSTVSKKVPYDHSTSNFRRTRPVMAVKQRILGTARREPRGAIAHGKHNQEGVGELGLPTLQTIRR